MLNLMDRAFEAHVTVQDQAVYLTSVQYFQNTSTDEENVCEKIKNLIASPKTRLSGLVLLDVALQQCPDIYFKSSWLIVILKTLQEPASKLMKDIACKIASMAIKILAKTPAGNEEDIKKCKSDLFPCLVEAVNNHDEWKEAALECLYSCLKYFGREFELHKGTLMNIIMLGCFQTVSSRTFELYANCFSVLPACKRNQDPDEYNEAWRAQYLTGLKTLICTFKTLIFKPETDSEGDPPLLDEVIPYPLNTARNEDIFCVHMQKISTFVNLCKCLAKMLSTNSLFPVTVPIEATIHCVSNLFQADIIPKSNTQNSPPIEHQLIMSSITQLQIAGLELLEAVILNFNLNNFKSVLCDILQAALQASTSFPISSETISPIRHVVWKLLNIWFETSSLATFVVHYPVIIKELLKDISAEDVPTQTSGHPTRGRPKKNPPPSVGSKINLMNNDRHIITLEALKVLKNIINSGGINMPTAVFQDIYSQVISVCHIVAPQHNFPYPYDEEECRKKLYSVLFAVVTNLTVHQRDMFVTAFGILQLASRDPSTKVSKIKHRMNCVTRFLLQPKKPVPIVTSIESRQKGPAGITATKYSEWSVEDPYVPNVPPPVENVQNVAESVTPRISQTFHNPSDSEMAANDFVVDTYNETAAENQCNGDDIMEVPSTSQCQDEMEESEEEDEEEEDEEDEMNQDVDMQTDQVYIPSTNEMKVLSPVHINPETLHTSVAEQEYEELRPSTKSQASVVENSIKSQQNGARSLVPDEIESECIKNVSNANGIYISEDDEMEEEEGEEDEEEEEVTFPAEKKVPVFAESSSKMPRLETENEVKNESQEEEMDQRTRSPTLGEMKADFQFIVEEDTAAEVAS